MEKSIPIENSGQIGVLVASSISIFIATVSVGLRIIAKRLTGGLDYSEYCIIAALVCPPPDSLSISSAH
jgi:hypothetical protein